MHRYRQHLLPFLITSIVINTTPILAQNFSARMGDVIMTNGFFSQDEWADASQVKLNNHVVLYAKQDSNYIYIGIRTIESIHTGLDLYIASSAKSRMLFHVSSAFADATYADGRWSEWRWEQNQQWGANKIGLYHDGEKQCSSEPEGFEFQIDKAMFRGKIIYLALHLKRPEYVYPSIQDREAFKNWIQLRIDE